MPESTTLSPTKPTNRITPLASGGAPASAPFERAYEEHAGLMQRLAVNRYGLPDDEARSLVHDIFTAYIADPATIRGPLRPYFVGAICNASRAYWRKRGRETPLISAEELASEEHTDGEKRDLSLDLDAVISQLAPHCQATIRQFYFEGGTCDEIAAAMHTSRAHVHQILHSCRARIRALLKVRTKRGVG